MNENDLRTSNFRSRFWGYVGDQLSLYGGSGLLSAHGGNGSSLDGRKGKRTGEYAVRWAYYENKRLYHYLAGLGLGPGKIDTEYNPVPAIVAFYIANTLAGDLEIEPTPLETAEGESDGRNGAGDGDFVESNNGAVGDVEAGEALVAAIQQVWEWSNIDVLKQSIVESAVVLRDVYIKVAERTQLVEQDNRFGEVTAVYMQQVATERVRYCQVDERGYVTAIRIDTPRVESIFGLGDREHILVEIWRKDWSEPGFGDDGTGGVRFYETEGRAHVEDKDLPDPVWVETFEELGYDFIPVVAATVPTYWWQETDKIDRYNRLAFVADRLNRPLMVVLGNTMDSDGRPMPAPPVTTSQLQASYYEAGDGTIGILRMPGRSTAEFADAPIDFSSHLRRMERLQAHIEDSLPEYRMATLGANQIATETLKILLSMAGQRVQEVRAILERALVRAQMMALTIGQVAGLEMFAREQIGVYENGELDHQFARRDVFTMSEELQAVMLKNLISAGIPVKLAMKMAGYQAVVIDLFDEMAAEQALRERMTLAGAMLEARDAFDRGEADNGTSQL